MLLLKNVVDIYREKFKTSNFKTRNVGFIVMNYIERLGKFAIKQQSEELLFMTIDTLENVGLLAARRKLINTTSISSAYLKDIGLDAYEKGLNHLVYLVPEAISNIGEAAAKEVLPEAVKIAAENLKSIGTEATTALKHKL